MGLRIQNEGRPRCNWRSGYTGRTNEMPTLLIAALAHAEEIAGGVCCSGNSTYRAQSGRYLVCGTMGWVIVVEDSADLYRTIPGSHLRGNLQQPEIGLSSPNVYPPAPCRISRIPATPTETRDKLPQDVRLTELADDRHYFPADLHIASIAVNRVHLAVSWLKTHPIPF